MKVYSRNTTIVMRTLSIVQGVPADYYSLSNQIIELGFSPKL